MIAAGAARAVRVASAHPVPLAAGAGAGAALGQVPWGVWPLAIGGLAALIVLAGREPKRAGRIGWAFGTAHFLVALHWITEPFAVDAAVPDALGWVALVLLAGGLGLFPALAMWAGVRVRAPLPVAAPVLLLAAEVLRMRLFTGFPWAAPGQVLVDTPMLGLAALGGPHLLDAVILASAGLLAAAAARPALAAVPVVGLAAAWVWGATLPSPEAPSDAPLVRLVQPGTEQGEKWRPELRDAAIERQIALTGDGDAPALTVWPETSLLYWLHESAFLLQRVGAEAGGPVIVGANRWDGERVFNAAVLVGVGGGVEAIYDKHHLVPFGEYVPLRGIADRIGLRGLAQVIGEGFAPGSGPAVIEVPGVGPVLPLICYEAVFPASLRGTTRPRAIVQITNDAWFGLRAGPEQHFAQARVRAAESGLPLLRSANTGITAVVDARGRVAARLAGRGPGRLDAPIPPALPPTPYWRTGDGPLLGVLAMLLAGLAWTAVPRRD